MNVQVDSMTVPTDVSILVVLIDVDVLLGDLWIQMVERVLLQVS